MSIKFNYASIKRHENCLWCPLASAVLGNCHKFCLILPLFFLHFALIGPYLFIIASSCFFQFLCYFIFILLLINSLWTCYIRGAHLGATFHQAANTHTLTDAHILPPLFLIFLIFSSTLFLVMSLLVCLTVGKKGRQRVLQSLSPWPFIAAAVASSLILH